MKQIRQTHLYRFFEIVKTLGVQRPLNNMEKTIVLVGIYNQQFQGTIFLMVCDFQGKC